MLLENLQYQFFNRVTGRQRVDLDEVIKPGPFLNQNEALAIYERAYQTRLISCLGEQFPATKDLLGSELFNNFMRNYLATSPPKSFSLTDLPIGLVSFLEQSRPDAELPPASRDPMFDSLIEMARIEHNYLAVMMAKGLPVSDENHPKIRHLISKSPDHQAYKNLVITTESKPLQIGFSCDDYIKAIRAGKTAEMPEKREKKIILLRHRYDVIFLEL